MTTIAPPPGTTDEDDRDDACQDALEPELTRITTLAVSDIRHIAGPQVAIDMLEGMIEAVRSQTT